MTITINTTTIKVLGISLLFVILPKLATSFIGVVAGNIANAAL